MKQPTVWIDLENTPHVPFFVPIIDELQRRGLKVILTARDFAQTIELARSAGLAVMIVGKGAGSSPLRKAVAILKRAMKLAWILRGRGIDLSVGHGSRGLLLASRLLRIRSLTLYDYEGASVRLFNRWSTYVMTPSVIPEGDLVNLGLDPSRHYTYDGLKEEVYLNEFKPSTTLPVKLGLKISDINVVVRPPSDTAHYRVEASKPLFREIMRRLVAKPEVHVILLPRDTEQRAELVSEYGSARSVTIPERAIDAASLLFYADLVIGGGGTMNREAAVLGVPVLSIFKGPEGAVDRWLKREGKMWDIETASEVEERLVRRQRGNARPSSGVRDTIVEQIVRLSSAK